MARHSSRPLKWFGPALVVVGALVATTFFAVSWSIESGISTTAGMARRDFPGDQIEALMSVADSGGHSFRERNRAVWALGRLRDRRALPLLEKHYIGGTCDHEHKLCQHELKKAINLIRAKD